MQYPLPIAHARNTDPRNSHLAAAKVNVTESNQHVINILGKLQEATSNEIENYARIFQIPVSSSRVRGSLSPSELLGAGLIEIVSEEGKSKHGNPANVYRLTVAGKALVRPLN